MVSEADTPIAHTQPQLTFGAPQTPDIALPSGGVALHRLQDALGDLTIEPTEVPAGCRCEDDLCDHTPNSR